MLKVGVLIFPDAEELDFVGPFEVLSFVNKVRPGSTEVRFVAETAEPVRAYNGMRVVPDVTLDECPQLDILVIPGGQGRRQAMKNPAILDFVKRQQPQARYITSVCTGSFVLAETGLLDGKKATTYHEYYDDLAAYPIEVVREKVVPQGQIITAGGVSSGIELGFYLLRELYDAETSQKVADKIEYVVDVKLICR